MREGCVVLTISPPKPLHSFSLPPLHTVHTLASFWSVFLWITPSICCNFPSLCTGPCLDDLPMPLLDIATAQPSRQNSLHTFRSQAILQSKFVSGNERLFSFLWKPFVIPETASNFTLGRVHVRRCGLMIKAVATLEPTRLTQRKKDFGLRVDVEPIATSSVPGAEELCLDEDEAEPDDREKLRRLRISKANKGNTPWNKGRRHSPETLQRIKERTRLAMQNPKVKEKLSKLGHAQSEETKVKIGVGVRIGWEKRREKLLLQETCLNDWQNIVAEASRKGVLGQEELQWNSYKIQNEQLEQEWVESVAERRKTPRTKGSKRAPKSLEQRRKISESIAAKWADPLYRTRVRAGLVKFHGITEAVEKKPRATSESDGETRRRSQSKRKSDSDDESATPESRSQTPRVKRKSKTAPFKDPLASSKLEMLKNIRAERAAIESKKTEAVARAKSLIAEAEKAADALEEAAKQSPLARASLIETRRLIAEAIQSISSIDEGQEEFSTNGSICSIEDHPNANQIAERKINGAHTLLETSDFDEKSAFQDLLNDDDDDDDTVNGTDVNLASGFLEQISDQSLNGNGRVEDDNSRVQQKLGNVRKKWVRGRLVEVDEDGN